MANPIVDLAEWKRVEDVPAFSMEGWEQIESAPTEVETIATLPVERRQDSGDLADLDASLAREDEFLEGQAAPVEPVAEGDISSEVSASIESQLVGKTSAHLLQESLGITADGILGPQSIAAAKAKWGEDGADVVKGIKAQQRAEFKDTTTALSEQIAPSVGSNIKPKWIQALWLHESAMGNKVLGDTFNLGNIKPKGTQAFKEFGSVWEVIDGEDVRRTEKFRKFDNFKEAALGWAEFVSSDRYEGAREAKSLKGFLKALHDAGYATDPKWVEGVMKAHDSI